MRPLGSGEFGTRCEIKNLNSLRSLGRAIEYEARRQIDLLESGGTVDQETRHWNEAEGRTITGRSKEEAYDYRYFPEPDLVPVAPDAAWLEQVRASLPVLPAERRARLAELAAVAPADTALVVELDLDVLVEAAVKGGADARRALNRAGNELAANLAAARTLDPAAFTTLLKLEDSGGLTATQAKEVLGELLERGGDPAAIAAERGYEAMDTGDLEQVVDQVLAAHAGEFERYKEGDQKLMGFFVKQVMDATGKKADGKAVSALLRARAAGNP
jgi:aspartyl-tRNA(Asn)/glutamyl-tRNA(Gln) amidotransferase subunit B